MNGGVKGERRTEMERMKRTKLKRVKRSEKKEKKVVERKNVIIYYTIFYI